MDLFPHKENNNGNNNWTKYGEISNWNSLCNISSCEQSFMKKALWENKTLYHLRYDECTNICSGNNFERLKAAIKEWCNPAYFDFYKYSSSLNSKVNTFLFSGNDLVLSFRIHDDSETVEFLTTSKEIFDRIENFIKGFVYSRPIEMGSVFVIGRKSPDSPLCTKKIGKIKSEFVRDNYSKSVVDDLDFAMNQWKSANPIGKLLILDGPPGTGKTYIVRSMINQIGGTLFFIVPANMITDISSPEFIELISNKKNNYECCNGDDDSSRPVAPHVARENDFKSITLIIEDADEILKSRTSKNVSAISQVLNIGDGLIGGLLDLRIIMTSNIKIDKIDSALMRPGRLCKLIHIDLLEPEHARNIYKRLTNNDAPNWAEPKSLADVYRDAHEIMEKNIGTKTNDDS